MKNKTAIKTILGIFLFFSTFLAYVNAQSYVFVEDGDVVLNANIDIDIFSELDLVPSTVEIQQPSNVEIRTINPNGTAKPNRQIQIYIDGNSTGVTITQPPNTNMYGETTGTVKSSIPNTYTVCAIDTTETYDIQIDDCEVLYVVPVPVPTVIEEPQYTKGSTNTISWTMTGTGTYQYYAQASTNATFTEIVHNSGWIGNRNYQFENLLDAQMYFFRVKSRNIYGGESNWSNSVFSVQDQTGPTIEIISVSDIGQNNTTQWDPNYTIKIKYRIKDNVSITQRDFWCLDKNGDKDECTYTPTLTGDFWEVSIKLKELDQQNNNLLEEYKFCAEAKDSVDNVSRNCEATLNIPLPDDQEPQEEEETPITIPEDISKPVGTTTRKVIDTVEKFFDNTVGQLEENELENITISTTTANVAIGFATLLAILGNIPYFILQALLGLQSFFGFRKKASVTGYVYDSLTKEPVGQAIIRIFNENNELVWTDVTDGNGYYKSTQLEDGEYCIKVTAGNYTFPSKTIFGKKDFPMENVYHGEVFLSQQGQLPTFSIPLDLKETSTLKQTLGQFFYNTKTLWKILHLLLFILGFFFSIYTAVSLGIWWTYISVVIYAPSLAILLYTFFNKQTKYGVVTDEKGLPVQGAVVSLNEKEFGRLISKRVTDKLGRYRFIVGKGLYEISILNSDLKVTDEKTPREFIIKKNGANLIAQDIVVRKLEDTTSDQVIEPLQAL